MLAKILKFIWEQVLLKEVTIIDHYRKRISDTHLDGIPVQAVEKTKNETSRQVYILSKVRLG